MGCDVSVAKGDGLCVWKGRALGLCEGFGVLDDGRSDGDALIDGSSEGCDVK